MLQTCSGCKVSGIKIESYFWSACFKLEHLILNSLDSLHLLAITFLYVDWFTFIWSQYPMSILIPVRLFLVTSLKYFLGLCLAYLLWSNSPWNSCWGNLTSSILVRCLPQHIWLPMWSISILDVLARWITMVSGVRDCHLVFNILLRQAWWILSKVLKTFDGSIWSCFCCGSTKPNKYIDSWLINTILIGCCFCCCMHFLVYRGIGRLFLEIERQSLFICHSTYNYSG